VFEFGRSQVNPLAGPLELRRLGKNINGYFGETIAIAAVLGECVAAARAHGWSILEIQATPQLTLLAFTRVCSRPLAASDPPAAASLAFSTGAKAAVPPPPRRLRVYISTGIHGDEPAGPLAARQLLEDDQWPAGVELWLCPCLNPEGFRLARRENGQGLDLNRQYLNPQAPETVAHIAWLQQQPAFDLCLCLHEDWEAHGFYVYELNPDHRPSLAEPMVAAAARVCPIDRSEIIEGRPAHEGIIRPGSDPRSRPDWPESFFLLTHKVRLSYTLEAPSDFPLACRVAALTAATRAALEGVTNLISPRRAGSVDPSKTGPGQ
jgi:protein MpaA